MFLVAVMLTNPPIDRSVWSLRRSTEWLYMAETTFTDRQWYENFRVSRETFQYIVSEVIHEIRRQDTMFRKAVCPSTKVAILLYYLGSDLLLSTGQLQTYSTSQNIVYHSISQQLTWSRNEACYSDDDHIIDVGPTILKIYNDFVNKTLERGRRIFQSKRHNFILI